MKNMAAAGRNTCRFLCYSLDACLYRRTLTFSKLRSGYHIKTRAYSSVPYKQRELKMES